MQQRSFGKSSLKTSVLGFGGWPMGKGHYGPIEDKDAIAAAHRAFDLGITLFDTAAIYGWGAGEELMGRSIKPFRDKIALVTKGGLRWNEKEQRSDRDSSKAYLRECLEGSLRRLQTDYIDLYLIHWPDEARPMQEPMEAFADFQREGKIRFGGVSNFSVKQMEDCLKHFPIITNQVGYHLFDKRMEPEVFPFLKSHGMGAMGYGPMAHGLLTGTFTKDMKFTDDDWRRRGMAFGQPLFTGDTFLKNLETVERLKKVAARSGHSVAQLAIAWVISNPIITVALVGARQPSEIDEDLKAAEWKLTDRDKKEIAACFQGQEQPG